MKIQLLDGPYNSQWVNTPDNTEVGDILLPILHEDDPEVEYEVIEWPQGELVATYLNEDVRNAIEEGD